MGSHDASIQLPNMETEDIKIYQHQVYMNTHHPQYYTHLTQHSLQIPLEKKKKKKNKSLFTQVSATDSVVSSAPLIIDMRSRASILASPSCTNCSSLSCSVTSMLTSKRGVRRHISSPNRPGSPELFSVYSISSMCFRLRYCLTTSRLRRPLDSSVCVCVGVWV